MFRHPSSDGLPSGVGAEGTEQVLGGDGGQGTQDTQSPAHRERGQLLGPILWS